MGSVLLVDMRQPEALRRGARGFAAGGRAVTYYVGACALGMLMCWLFGLKSARELPESRVARWLPIMPFMLLSVFRYGIGNDYIHAYRYIFENVSAGYTMEQVDTEPTFYFLNKLVVQLGGDQFWVIAVMAIIFHAFMWKFILENSENIAFSLALLLISGLFTWSFNGVRQAASIAICCWATRYAKKATKANVIKYIVAVLAASTFHTTALLYLPLILLLRHDFKPRDVVIAAVLVAVIYATGNVFEQVVDEFFADDYSWYYDSKYDKGGYWSIVVEWLVFGAVVFFAKGRLLERVPTALPMASAALFGVFMACLSSLIPNSERISFMFLPFVVVLLPSLPKSMDRGIGYILCMGCCAILLVKWVNDMCVIGDGDGTLQYVSIFTQWFGWRL